jgi:predicted nucleic-acid-binding protein
MSINKSINIIEEDMQLTEEQIQEREALILTILDEFIEENFDVDPEYVMTEEDAYVTSIIIEHFENNFKFPTLSEEHLEEITGYDINTELYEELAEALLDETVGSFVAGAAHGIRNALSAYKKSSADRSKTKSVKADEVARKRLKDFKAGAPKPTGTGAIGAARSEFQAAKMSAIQKRADRARATRIAAETKRKSAAGKHQYNKDNTKQLGNRIDAGIQNIKNKAKQAISTGAARIGGILGKVAGHMAR